MREIESERKEEPSPHTRWSPSYSSPLLILLPLHWRWLIVVRELSFAPPLVVPRVSREIVSPYGLRSLTMYGKLPLFGMLEPSCADMLVLRTLMVWDRLGVHSLLVVHPQGGGELDTTMARLSTSWCMHKKIVRSSRYVCSLTRLPHTCHEAIEISMAFSARFPSTCIFILCRHSITLMHI